MNDSAYREKYGLSYAEFLAEPIAVYLKNMEILGVEAELHRAEQRRLQRQSHS